jgi:hypothetical protein
MIAFLLSGLRGIVLNAILTSVRPLEIKVKPTENICRK